MAKKWQVLSKKVVFENKWRKFEEWQLLLPNGTHGEFIIQVRGDFSVVFGITADKKILLIRQYYYADGVKVPSLVAGYIDPGESKLKAAKRELKEETGYVGKMKYLGAVLIGKYTTGKAHFYLAADIQKKTEQELETSEDIDVELLSLKEFKKLLQKGQLHDAFSQACAYQALTYLGL